MEDLLQKHSLQEADIAVQAERVESLNKAALKFTTIEGMDSLINVLKIMKSYVELSTKLNPPKPGNRRSDVK